MTDARVVADTAFRALPFGGTAFALLLSVTAHAAVVLALAQRPARAAFHSNLAHEALVEIAAPDLAMPDAPADVTPAQSATLAAPHSHPYPVPRDHDFTPHDPSLNHVQPTPSESHAAPAAAPAVLDSPAPVAPRFVITLGSAARAPGGVSASDGQVRAPGSNITTEPVPETAVDTSATLLAGNSPSYTPEAEAAGVEADVPLEIVVDGAGKVIGARALAHVGYGLDEAALRGVRAYRFSPARRAGKPLAVRMRWIMRFQLR